VGGARLVALTARQWPSCNRLTLATSIRHFCEAGETIVDEADVLIVGGGPAGLASAITLRRLAEQNGKDIRVVLLEKAAEVGAHTLSGCALDPKALNELFPDWKEKGAPVETEVQSDRLLALTESKSYSMPIMPEMNNHGNYIISLSQLVRWMGQQAEELGVEIYPGTAARHVLYHPDGSVKGIVTSELGVGKDGQKKDNYEPGMEIHARCTIFGEGCRGSLAGDLFEKHDLRRDCQHQTYGIGIKEVWRIDPAKFKKGSVTHTFNWPLDPATYGGSFLYHYDENLVSVGFVVGLDYHNPYLNPYKEFQRWKQHPDIVETFRGGECLSYGARAISEGGYQSVPKLYCPGAAIVGDSAGFLNVPKIKGTHTAMKSGMLCGEALFEKLQDENSEGAIELDNYERSYKSSWLHDELYRVRNFRPSFQYGLPVGMLMGGALTFTPLKMLPVTLSHPTPDDKSLKPAAECKDIDYPKPDGVISFDLLTNLARSNTSHEEDQPCHLTLVDRDAPLKESLPIYDGPEQRFCPANVYEYVKDEEGNPRFQINQSNCIHCKTCDIKASHIKWVPPEGGGGPIYDNL